MLYVFVCYAALLVFKLKKTVGSNKFAAEFIKIISHYKNIGVHLCVATDLSIDERVRT